MNNTEFEVKAAIEQAIKDIQYDYQTEKEMMATEAKMNLTLKEYLMEHEEEIIARIREEQNIPEDAKLYFDYDKLLLVCVPNVTAEYYDIDFIISDANATDDSMEITATPTIRMKTSVLSDQEK